ncbi:ParA family protein [Alteriqipengyuania lutimaris]|uniref:ParA family protein n=1 Tax=Alteriqipengyuania lutimaris TaxID=1538146 RepID=A0A395LP25_9SPHN|nr:ParA family protein [Alteriqipengyuania lutimaris]MBB3034715.1 cellulose biosynthesis protein BcsQ [Alteriqipengyuania lutimaris]RDS76430.1 ParA family protein [Alteriqipengyuania lutimaris]
MAVIAVYSMKGGVGKTTMAVDLAWRFSQRGGHETLLFDLDPQGGAGFLLGHEERKVQRAICAFHHARAPRDLLEPTKFDRLSLIGADQSLRDLPVQLARIGTRKRLAQMLGFMKGEYPRIVLDCPPMINEVSEQIMEAADLIVVPLPASPLAARAFGFIRNELAKRPGHPPVLPVLSMYDQRRKLHRWVRENAAANWPVIPQSSYVEQVAVRREPIAAFANWSPASQGFDQLHAALEAKLAQMGLGGPPSGSGQRSLPQADSGRAPAPQSDRSRVVAIRDTAAQRPARPAPDRADARQVPPPAGEGLSRRAFSF